jgi:inorganic pyrophosphatase
VLRAFAKTTLLRPTNFWAYVDELVSNNHVVIDRAKGTPHPKLPQFIYPLDYGYLENTISADGGGIDLFRGSRPEATVIGVLCTVDLSKRHMEFKLLLGCIFEEIAVIQDRRSVTRRVPRLTIRLEIQTVCTSWRTRPGRVMKSCA